MGVYYIYHYISCILSYKILIYFSPELHNHKFNGFSILRGAIYEDGRGNYTCILKRDK